MKIRTFRYIIKEGVVNAYKNKLMSLASVGIVIATLVIFGFFLLIALNLEFNLSVLEEQPQLEVFCYPELENADIVTVENEIKNNEVISDYQMVTKEQAFEKMKTRLEDDATVLDGFDENIFPISFIIKLKNNNDSEAVVEQLKNVTGVEEVTYSQDTIDVISKLSYWIKFFSAFMIIILLIVSVFIISNTIKLTVFARRKEISIMKFIGATDWFIRWPFAVEGVIIGIVGALAAFLITSYGYNTLESRFSNDVLSISIDFFKMIKLNEVWAQVLTAYCVIGAMVGAVGSYLSIRKHLRV